MEAIVLLRSQVGDLFECSPLKVPLAWGADIRWTAVYNTAEPPSLYSTQAEKRQNYALAWVAQQVVTVFQVRGKMPGCRCNWRRWESWPGGKHALNTRCKHNLDCSAIHTWRVVFNAQCCLSAYSWQSLNWSYRTQKSSSGKPLLLKRREFQCQIGQEERVSLFFLMPVMLLTQKSQLLKQ